MGRRAGLGRAAGVLVACAFAGSLLTAATARAESVGYYVYNLTGSPWTINEIIQYKRGFEPSPPGPPHPEVGQVLMPGVDPDHNHIEIRYHPDIGGAQVNYSTSLKGGNVGVYLDVNRAKSHCLVDGGPYVCQFTPSRFAATPIQILEPRGTEYDVPGADKAKQAEVLGNRVCTARNLAAGLGGCQFVPGQRAGSLGQPHLAGGVHPNCGTVELSVSAAVYDREVVSNSAGGKLGEGADSDYIFERALAFLEPKYGRWTEQHTFRGDVDFTVPPGHIGFVGARNPVMRDTGEFTMEIGNTHFDVRDLSFDSPDVGGKPEYTPIRQPMTAEQREQACKSGGSRRAPASFASIKRRGTGTGDALVGGRESTLLQGMGGNDILRGEGGNDRLDGGSARDALHGGSGHDSLHGRSGNDALDGGRGSDHLYGGPGSDTIVDPSGPTFVRTGTAPRSRPDSVDVRDGQADDTVICGSRRTIARADRGDRLRNCRTPAREGRRR
jgi:hemolysin type calcium-binding protein